MLHHKDSPMDLDTDEEEKIEKTEEMHDEKKLETYISYIKNGKIKYIEKNSASTTLVGFIQNSILKISYMSKTINNSLFVERQFYKYVIPDLLNYTPFLVRYITSFKNTKDIGLTAIIKNKLKLEKEEENLYDQSKQVFVVLEKAQGKTLAYYTGEHLFSVKEYINRAKQKIEEIKNLPPYNLEKKKDLIGQANDYFQFAIDELSTIDYISAGKRDNIIKVLEILRDKCHYLFDRVTINGFEAGYKTLVNNQINIDYKDVLKEIENIKVTLLNRDELFQIIFQVLWTLLCFNRIKMKHNDLHWGNIMVDKLDSPKTLYFKHPTTGKTIKLETQYMVKIFDFDRSSIYGNENISRNLYQDGDLCSLHGQCNYRSSKFDLWTFLYYFNIYKSNMDDVIYKDVFDFIDKICNLNFVIETNRRIKETYARAYKIDVDVLQLLTWKYLPLDYQWMEWDKLPKYKESELLNDGWDKNKWDNNTNTDLPYALKTHRYVDDKWNDRKNQKLTQLKSVEECFDILLNEMKVENLNIVDENPIQIYSLPKKVKLYIWTPKPLIYTQLDTTIKMLKEPIKYTKEEKEVLSSVYNKIKDSNDFFKIYDYELSLFPEVDWKSNFIKLNSYLEMSEKDRNDEINKYALMLLSCSVYHQIVLDKSLYIEYDSKGVDNILESILEISDVDINTLNNIKTAINKIWTACDGVLPIKIFNIGGTNLMDKIKYEAVPELPYKQIEYDSEKEVEDRDEDIKVKVEDMEVEEL